MQRGNKGVGKLAYTLDVRMKEHKDPDAYDFGIIKPDFSLLTNKFPIPVPKGDYSVCRLLAGLTTRLVSEGQHGGHLSGDGDHIHKIEIPKLKVGDRVLVVWVQEEPVVVDVIVRADSL